MSNPKPTIRVRITLVDPPPGVTFGVQKGASGVVDATQSSGQDLAFEFPLTIADAQAQPVRLTGEFAQGPASARFVYINSGTLSGQVGSCWTRRAKVPLSGLSAELLAVAVETGAVLAASIAGRAKDGGPACASVKLVSTWAVLPASGAFRGSAA